MLVGVFAAVLAMERLPEALPVVVGAKSREKEVDCPASRASGSASPATEKPAPLMLSAFSDT